jgi:hypothetical protein
MEYITNEVVDISFNGDSELIITYDNNLTETLVKGKETYDKMYKEWLKEQPPLKRQKMMVLPVSWVIS